MHCKLFLSFLVVFVLVSSSDLVVSEKCSVKLTDENFKSVIESNEFVFVFFYSATCPACRRFDPIWEDTSCSLNDKNIVFAHLEGNENQGVINAYSVTHTPTLALFHKDLSTPMKFNGQQYKESMIYFLKSEAGYEDPGSPAVHLTTEEEAYRFSFWRGNVDHHLETSVNGFFPSMDSDEYREYTKAVIHLYEKMRCGEIISSTVQESYYLEPDKPALVMYRDYDERRSEYHGEWKAEAIEEWASLLNYQTVGIANSQTIRNFFHKEGIMVHLFITKEIANNDFNTFQDYIFNEVAIPVIEQKIMKRGTFSIILSDGEENKQWLKGTDLQEMPSAMLIDFKSGYRYEPKQPLQLNSLSSDLIQFINDYSLGLAQPLRSVTDEPEL